MKPRIAAICAIVAFATCGDRAPAQFPDCAYITLFNPCPVSSETRGDCEPIIDPQVACQDCPPGAGAWWVVNNRKDSGTCGSGRLAGLRKPYHQPHRARVSDREAGIEAI